MDFDILYDTPWNATTLKRLGVQNLAYPTHWRADPPVYSGGMLQQGYSKFHHINLIAANGGAEYDNGGGIFQTADPWQKHLIIMII